MKDLLDVLGQSGQSSRSSAVVLLSHGDPPVVATLLPGLVSGLGNAILIRQGWKWFILETLL